MHTLIHGSGVNYLEILNFGRQSSRSRDTETAPAAPVGLDTRLTPASKETEFSTLLVAAFSEQLTLEAHKNVAGLKSIFAESLKLLKVLEVHFSQELAGISSTKGREEVQKQSEQLKIFLNTGLEISAHSPTGADYFQKLKRIHSDLQDTFRKIPQRFAITDPKELYSGDVFAIGDRRLMVLEEPDSRNSSIKTIVASDSYREISVATVTFSKLLEVAGRIEVERLEMGVLIPAIEKGPFILNSEMDPLQPGDRLYGLSETSRPIYHQIVGEEINQSGSAEYLLVSISDSVTINKKSLDSLMMPENGIVAGMRCEPVSAEEMCEELRSQLSLETNLRKVFEISKPAIIHIENTTKIKTEKTSLPLPEKGSVISTADGMRHLVLRCSGTELTVVSTDGEIHQEQKLSPKTILKDASYAGNSFLFSGKRERYRPETLRWEHISKGDVFHFEDGTKKEILQIRQGLNSTRVWVDSVSYLTDGNIIIERERESSDLELQTSALSVKTDEFIHSRIKTVSRRTEVDASRTGYFKHPLQSAIYQCCMKLEAKAAEVITTQTLKTIEQNYHHHRQKQSPAELSELDTAIEESINHLNAIHRASLTFQRQFQAYLMERVQYEGGIGKSSLALQRFCQLMRQEENSDIGHLRKFLSNLHTTLPETEKRNDNSHARLLHAFSRFVELLPGEEKVTPLASTILPGRLVHLDLSNITPAQIEQLINIENQKPGTPGAEAVESKGIITVKSTPESLYEQLKEGLKIIAYLEEGHDGNSEIKAFFNYFLPGKIPEDIRQKYQGVYPELDSAAYLDLYAVADDLQLRLRDAGAPGLMSASLFATHYLNLQRYGAEYHIATVEQQNLPSLVTILGELGLPNVYDVHLKHHNDHNTSTWISFAVPISPSAREEFRNYAGTERPSRSMLLAQIKENARVVSAENRYLRQMKESSIDADIRISIGAGNLDEKSHDRLMEYMQKLEGYGGRIHLGGTEMIKVNSASPDLPIRTKKNIYELQQGLTELAPDALIGNILIEPQNAEKLLVTNEKGEKEQVTVISRSENLTTILIRHPEIELKYEVQEVDWDLETHRSKDIMLRLHEDSIDESEERDPQSPVAVISWGGGGGIFKELCSYARESGVNGGIDIIVLPESGGASFRFYEAYQKYLAGDEEFAGLVHSENRVHIADSPEELDSILRRTGHLEKAGRSIASESFVLK